MVSHGYISIKYEALSENRVIVIANPSIIRLYGHIYKIHATLPKKFIKL